MIPLISTKQTITSHLKSMNIKKTMTYDFGNPGYGLGQAQNVAALHCLLESYPLDNMISEQERRVSLNVTVQLVFVM